MAHEQTDNSNNDILEDSAEKKRLKMLHYQDTAYKLVDFIWRSAKTPDDTSDREPLMALLKNPNTKTQNKSLMDIASLLQNKRVDQITKEIIESYSPFLSLYADIQRISIGKKLDKKDRAALGAASFGLFNTLFGGLGLLKLVTNGSETSVNLLFKRRTPSSPLESSILKKGHVIDPGGRTFENISSLQYAYWMGDWYMVDMLLKNLPNEYLAEAQRQINEVKRYDAEGKADLENQKGIEYQLYLDLDDPNGEITAEALQKAEEEGKGKSGIFLDRRTPVLLRQAHVEYHVSPPPENYDYTKASPIPEGKRRVLVTVKGEQHYDYQPLIKALKDYLPVYQRWQASVFNDHNLKAKVIHYWCKIVGLIQRYATAFLAQQYCHPSRSFENVTFDEPEFKNRSLNFYNIDTRQIIFWFLHTSGLGGSFGILRGRGAIGCLSDWVRGEAGGYLADLAAVVRLCEVSPEKMASVLRVCFAGLSQTACLPP